MEQQRMEMPREQVCAGLRDARAEVEQRLDGSHWLRYQGRYLPLRGCPLARVKTQPHKTKWTPPLDHPWRQSWKSLGSDLSLEGQ